MQKKLIVAAIAAIAVLVPAATASAAKPPPGGGITHNPILFVHGWSESSSIWGTMISRFQADGWTSAELNNWSYNTSNSNVTTASAVSSEVDKILKNTGATKVDLITHSMGGLNTRYYLKNLGGDAKVDDWVSLGGPNHGTDTANFCFSAACTEMRIGSPH
jgi:triacylglycerol lipase